MKRTILFIGVGTVHYINPLLNRLHNTTEYRVLNLISSNTRGHVGAGVYQTEAGIEYEVVKLTERTFLGRLPYFSGLTWLLWKLRPDLIVLSDYYSRLIFLNPLIRILRSVLGLKLAIRSIPFQLGTYEAVKSDNLNARPHDNTPAKRFFLRFPWTYRAILMSELALRKWVYSSADAHLCYTRAGTAIYSSYGADPKKVFTIFNSPDTDILLSAREAARNLGPLLPAGVFRLIHVGRLVPWKRVDLLIEALGRVRSQGLNAELIIIGDGPESARLKSDTERLGLSPYVRFAGAIYDPVELGRYYLSASVYVLAGMGGLSINEAMAFGKPVIYSQCDGTEVELIEDGRNGVRFQPGDLPDLVQAILSLSDSGTIDRMSDESMKIIRDKVNIHTVVDAYLAAFRNILNDN